jgi:pSer/pThr/pTyr-binding forkhead associated (FHA) protein
MTAAAQAFLPQQLYVSIIAGPDCGVAFKILSQKISIGREDDNDISLNDPRCSRHHAVIEQINGEVLLKDKGSQNGLIVNGQVCRLAKLKPGDIFILGDTQFQVQNSLGSMPVPSSGASHAPGPAPMPFPQNLPPQAPGKNPIFMIGIGVVGLIIVFSLFSGGTKKAKTSGIRSEDEVQIEIEASQKRKDEISRLKRADGQFSQQFMEAQAAFIQGFRDYREGNFGRAIQSFTAALALYPSHELAARYKKLSERRLDEMVQYSMFEARRYMEQNKYEMAKAAYKNIMITLNDPSSKTYQEAKERYEEIELILSGKF